MLPTAATDCQLFSMTENPNNLKTKNRPRLRTLEPTDGERHASWLELFFDLVFVLAVAQIAKVLVNQSDLDGFVKYIALFVPIWWSWVGFTFYADRFESEDTAYRVMMFAGMFTVAALSLTLGNAFSVGGDTAFLICYILVRLVLIALYIRSAYHIPLARSLSLQFITGFGISVALLLISFMFAPPFRYAIWAAALTLELVTPFLNLRATRTTPFDRSHIPERFGLFTIIVLGEAVIATANGAAETIWNFASVSAAALGFAMAAAIWWINFDFVEDSAIKSKSLAPRFIYLYGHFFIVASIVAIGIGVEHAIKEANDVHLHLPSLTLLSGGIAVYLAAVTIIKLASENYNLMYARIASIAAALSILYFSQFSPPLVVLAAYLAILVIGVYLENRYSEVKEIIETPSLEPCEHEEEAQIFRPRSADGCEECVKNNYKWVHLRLCLSCGHTGCCDSSRYKHATAHFRETGHPIMASLEREENWAWCYADEKYVPLIEKVENETVKAIN